MATWHKRVRKHKNAGRKRKNAEARHSTQSFTELFAGLGEPGQRVATAGAKAAVKAKKPSAAPAAAK